MSHLKPGAWVELAEVGQVLDSDDNSLPDDWAPKRAFDLTVEGLKALGRVAPDAAFLEKLLKDAGFVDVEVSDGLVYYQISANPSTGQNLQTPDDTLAKEQES